MLQAIIAGESNPEKLADLAHGDGKKKRGELVASLRGRIRAHHRELLRVHLNVIESLRQAMADIDTHVKSLGADPEQRPPPDEHARGE